MTGRPVGVAPDVALCHPLVGDLVKEVTARKITILELSERSGVGSNTIYQWYRLGRQPGVANLEACLNVVGLELTVVRR